MRIKIRIVNNDYLISYVSEIDIPVSAVARLIPTPPALVVRRKMKYSDPGALNASIDF